MTKNQAMATRHITNHRPSQDEIAARAYESFPERVATPGRDFDDWLQAELDSLGNEQKEWRRKTSSAR